MGGGGGEGVLGFKGTLGWESGLWTLDPIHLPFFICSFSLSTLAAGGGGGGLLLLLVCCRLWGYDSLPTSVS